VEEIRKIAKRTFSGLEGDMMLYWILDKCKFMDECKDENDMALNNFAKDLLKLIYLDDDNNYEPSFFEKIKLLLRKKK
jgi:hypothetical protein